MLTHDAVRSCPGTITNLLNARSTCDALTVNSTCAVTCNSGFVGGPAQYTCSPQAIWIGSITCNSVVCTTPTSLPANAAVRFGQCSGNFPSGRCTLLCNAGYTGATNLTCGADGNWAGSLTCQPCPSEQYQALTGQTACIPATKCVLNSTYETTPPTSTTNRVCLPVLSPCNTVQYQVRAPTLTSNRVCAPYTACQNGQYETQPGTPTSNRVCSPCTVCPEGMTARSGTCSLNQDTVCVSCSVCRVFEYQEADCSALSDRVCQPVTVCPIGYSQLVAPTETSNRICSSQESTPDDLPSETQVFVLASAAFSGVPANDPDFNLVFTTAVINTLKGTYPSASVTLFGVTSSGGRRAGETTTVAYRVEVAKDEVTNTAALTTAVGNRATLNTQMQNVGGSVSGDPSAYASTSTTFTKKPTIKQAAVSTTPKAGGSSGSDDNNDVTIIIAVCAGVGGIVIIALILAIIFRNPSRRQDADLNGDPYSKDLSAARFAWVLCSCMHACLILRCSGDIVELAEVKTAVSAAHRTRQASFFSSIRLADDQEESGA